jgi:surface antigen
MINPKSCARQTIQASTACLALASLLSGCAMAIPPLWGDNEPTSSIRPAPLLAERLAPTDLEKANPALTAALEPAHGQARVEWTNPASATRGSFVPVGAAYRTGDKLCRAFTGQVTTDDKTAAIEGRACRAPDGQWTQLAEIP